MEKIEYFNDKMANCVFAVIIPAWKPFEKKSI
jgi:hypothetical protein